MTVSKIVEHTIIVMRALVQCVDARVMASLDSSKARVTVRSLEAKAMAILHSLEVRANPFHIHWRSCFPVKAHADERRMGEGSLSFPM